MDESDAESADTIPADDKKVEQPENVEKKETKISNVKSTVEAKNEKAEDEYSDIFSSDEEISSTPKFLTARQLSMQGKKSSKDNQDWGAESKPSKNQKKDEKVNWTSEQLLAHVEKTEKRKELARSKVEQEKRQVVERLLKVNTESSSVGQRPRGLNKKVKFGYASDNSDSNSDSECQSPSSKQEAALKSRRKEAAKRHGLSLKASDPLPGYLRTISSQKLPTSVVTFSPTDASQLLKPPTMNNSLHSRVTTCQIKGCKNKRAYSCSKTGLVLCSQLACYHKAVAS
ncbi:hypothetical protein Ciccas_012668 [Cichlidogyrus casuarinus]|uniref:INO80 complex subunit B-like conserved region domain-containing protein n=1 Tax=Cichlidogyrus casuarinus TaxID=1844966 RepID=A0ABD2PPK3_9PLAT